MTTLEQVKTYVQNHLVAVVATSVLAMVAVPTVVTTVYQTIKNEKQDGFLSCFNLRSYGKKTSVDNDNTNKQKLQPQPQPTIILDNEIKDNDNTNKQKLQPQPQPTIILDNETNDK